MNEAKYISCPLTSTCKKAAGPQLGWWETSGDLTPAGGAELLERAAREDGIW